MLDGLITMQMQCKQVMYEAVALSVGFVTLVVVGEVYVVLSC